jgi:hypothetical protein
MRRLFPALLVLLAAVSLASCGDDATASSYPNIAGSWTYNASNLSGSGIPCGVTGATLSLSQSGSTFTGSYSNARLFCIFSGETLLDDVASGSVVNGEVSEAGSVSFDFDTPDFAQHGTISGNSMSGTATWRMDYGGTAGISSRGRPRRTWKGGAASCDRGSGGGPWCGNGLFVPDLYWRRDLPHRPRDELASAEVGTQPGAGPRFRDVPSIEI